MHLQLLANHIWVSDLTDGIFPLLMNQFYGISFILYPIYGIIAEAYSSNFKMIRLSLVLMIIGSLVMVVMGAIILLQGSHPQTLPIVFAIVSGAVTVAGLGMYESTAIQFGVSQMLEASSEQLSSFIHWYFWCTNIGPLIRLYFFIAVGLYFKDCVFTGVNQYDFNSPVAIVFVSITIVQVLIFSGWLVCFQLSKQQYFPEQPSRNSLLLIFKVLKYAFKHNQPTWRSAFTYWESSIPSRINLGMQKYGGPFTYEEVENVKAFFRLLLLVISLFGFQLLGDGHLLINYIMKTYGCPVLTIPIALIVVNPQHISILVAVIGTPLLQLLKRYAHRFIPTMLNRLWIGLYAALAAEALQTLYAGLLEGGEPVHCPQLNDDFPSSIFKNCVFANIKVKSQNECTYFCSSHPVSHDLYYVYLAIVPLLMYGVSYLLVFATVLEFICAQSPNEVKGLLIGIWYSMQSLKYTLIGFMDSWSRLMDTVPWSIYNGAKGLGILLSIFSFSVTYRNYRYRERNEVVPEQAIIEEQYERELLMHESSESYSSVT